MQPPHAPLSQHGGGSETGLRFSEEDKEHITRRAEVLALLARPDNVSREQLSLLSSVTADEAARNAAAAPVLNVYVRFLSDLAAQQRAVVEAAQLHTAAAKREHDALQARLEAMRDVDEQRSANAAAAADLVRVQARTQDVLAAIDVAKRRQAAHEDGIAKLEREVAVDIARLVEDDQRIALQRAELEALEKEYLLTEQRVFSLQRDANTVSESNAELMKICDTLMRRLEGVSGGQ